LMTLIWSDILWWFLPIWRFDVHSEYPSLACCVVVEFIGDLLLTFWSYFGVAPHLPCEWQLAKLSYLIKPLASPSCCSSPIVGVAQASSGWPMQIYGLECASLRFTSRRLYVVFPVPFWSGPCLFRLCLVLGISLCVCMCVDNGFLVSPRCLSCPFPS
jgi:hypothetical protein